MRDWEHFRAVRDTLEVAFRGSRADLERVTALRLQSALVLIFLAGRCVHLAQAGVDLVLAGGAYTNVTIAVGLGAACAVESVILAVVTLRAGRLVRAALLVDGLFGMAALVAMSVATVATRGRAGSLNWMLPYTVGTAAGLGLVASGDLETGAPRGRGPGAWWRRSTANGAMRRGGTDRLASLWPPVLALVLAGAYLVSVSVPQRLPDEGVAQIWGNAANYPLFFAVAALAMFVLRRRLAVIASRNAEVTQAAAKLAHEAQWRAVTVDVFGPVVDLLDRVADLGAGKVPVSVRDEAGRLIWMIEAVRPLERDMPLDAAPSSGNTIVTP
ncbi:MAG: hypothetical protein QOF30_1118 [Acidimicrobiaceae bacterium]|jgi:hypothetical protein|nr:hypothetical protein [Acidimicrobiaceae bacterium]